MALEVGIVGLPGAGKTTLFTALTQDRRRRLRQGERRHGVDRRRPARRSSPQLVGARKITPATIRVVDVPGTGRRCSAACARSTRSSSVADGFSPGADPRGDLETLELELLVADRDHVERRLERVEKQAKSGDAKLRKEVEQLQALLAHLDAGHTLRDFAGELPAELEPLTTKPLLAVENGPGGIDLAARGRARGDVRRGGGRVPRRPVRARRGRAAAPRRARPDHVLHRGREGDARLDAPPRPDRARGGGVDPLRHRARLHPLRGDLDRTTCSSAGSHAEAAKRGTQRLEGKTYVVQDGDVLNIRFNV